MKQAFPSISEATKARLEAKGFTPIRALPLEPWQNPHSDSCMIFSFLINLFFSFVFSKSSTQTSF